MPFHQLGSGITELSKGNVISFSYNTFKFNFLIESIVAPLTSLQFQSSTIKIKIHPNKRNNVLVLYNDFHSYGFHRTYKY